MLAFCYLALAAGFTFQATTLGLPDAFARFFSNLLLFVAVFQMKNDMAGAATIAASMAAMARLGIRRPAVAALGLAENMTSGSASRPGDVVKSLAGPNVEIRNTDCEGRLVLADCAWPMPVDAGFHDELKSDFADFVNWPGVTYGNASIAAAFLEKFVSYAPNGSPLRPPGGTGFGLRMLVDYLAGESVA